MYGATDILNKKLTHIDDYDDFGQCLNPTLKNGAEMSMKYAVKDTVHFLEISVSLIPYIIRPELPTWW